MVLLAVIISLVLSVMYLGYNYQATGETISITDKYPTLNYLGTFYDAGKGEIFTDEYDVFAGEESKGYFPDKTALEICNELFSENGKSVKVWSPKETKFRLVFTFEGTTKTEYRNAYPNYCYGQ